MERIICTGEMENKKYHGELVTHTCANSKSSENSARVNQNSWKPLIAFNDSISPI